MLNTSVTQIALIISTTEALGQKVPAEISKAHTRYTRVLERAARMYVGGEALTVATLRALDEDRDPAADPEVQRITTSHLMGNEHHVQALRAILTDGLLQAVARNANTLVKTWQRPFDQATATIARVGAHLGPIDLNDAAAILAKGGNAAEQWTEAKQADTAIDSILSAWTSLAIQTQFAPNDRRLPMLRFTNPSLDEWENLQLIDRRMSAWDAHHAGLTLSLADGPEFTARWQRIETARQLRTQNSHDQSNGKRSPHERAQMMSNIG